MTLSSAQADTLVQWGDIPSGAGTPGTNIVSANQIMVGVVSTYSGNTNNPPVGANYYPDSTGRSPRFSVAVSSTTQGGGRLAENATSGDRLAIYAATTPAGGTFRGMVMWFSNDFLNGSTPVTFTSVTVSVIQRVNPDTTGQGLHIVVRQGDNYYLSDGAAFGSSLTTQTFALATRTWSAFTPFVAGTETIGSPVGTPTFNAVQAIGLYFTAQNGGAAAGTCGANISGFVAEGTTSSGGPTYTLQVQPDNSQHGHVSPTGGLYNAGTPVELTATASNYYIFTGWSGDLGGATNPVTITMNADKSIVATFSELLATNETPLWWLAAHGLATNDAGALSDDDHDGHAAWQEYLAGTLPTVATSVLKITSLQSPGGQATLSWSTVSDRVYQVSWSTNLMEPYTPFTDATALVWTANTYTDQTHSAPPILLLQVEARRVP